MTQEKKVIAVDLGGTKLSVALVDTAGTISLRKKVFLEQRDISGCVEQIVRSIRDVGEAGAVGLIVPGVYFAESGNVWAPNLWGHKEVPLRTKLEKCLHSPVVIDSDRAGYVIGEHWLGVAQGLKHVVFLSVGTGIGAGILADGSLVRGSGDIAGAVGWFAFTSHGQARFKEVGCWEAEAAGPALARRAGAASAEEAVAAARRGDPAAKRAVAETAEYLAMGIANIVSILNPEMIVLGGGLMQAGDLFLDPIRNRIGAWAQPLAARQVRIELTRLGEDAGLLGAARLALNYSGL
jgi:glucokinase